MNHLIETLKQYPNWICYKKEERNGKTTKIPYIADSRRNYYAKVTDGTTWRSYQEAQEVKGLYDGVGFVLTPSLPFVCIDLDHCYNAKTQEVTEKAGTILALMADMGGTYTEFSPSGEGFHIWGIGILPQVDDKEKSGIKKNEIEIYRYGRYMTVTENAFVDKPLKNIQPAIDEMIRRYDLLGIRENQTHRKAPIQSRPKGYESTEFDDDFIIKKASTSASGLKFQRLFRAGDMSEYGDDQSRADVALLSMLAWWTNGNAAQMERIFMRSKLAETLDRKKHHEEDYLARTTKKALMKWEEWGRGCYWPKSGIVLEVHFPDI